MLDVPQAARGRGKADATRDGKPPAATEDDDSPEQERGLEHEVPAKSTPRRPHEANTNCTKGQETAHCDLGISGSGPEAPWSSQRSPTVVSRSSSRARGLTLRVRRFTLLS